MAEYEKISYPGSSSFFPGDTPFGYYDDDSTFQEDAEKVAIWCATRLGYPIMDVELQDPNFFAAFEEATSEYSNQVNTYQGRDNILNLLGFNTSSIANLSNKFINPSVRGLFRLAKNYATEASSGGPNTFYSASLDISTNQQTYNLSDATYETGSYSDNNFTIRKIFHYSPPAISKYLDPFLGSGLGTQSHLAEFGWDTMSTQVSFLLLPLYADVQRLQAIELNDKIRKSSYSFHLAGNRLRIYPNPTYDYTLWFYYTIDDEFLNRSASETDGKITNISNIPYFHFPYQYINDIGKRWIKRYALAICKEMLGNIRGKYQSIPIPGSETTINGSDLLSQASEEKQALIEELKEILDQYSRQSQLERKSAEAEVEMELLKKVPLKIYIR